jgi:alkanesulfonate monooxygenase SsuD/methylene tetrahydromethanopterin reductase-like flavin-dependent oxidoreductase (luciferase family)
MGTEHRARQLPPASRSPLMTHPTRRGLGISAGLDPGLARDLAALCEHLGYHSLWSNDEPSAPGLETLSHFAAGAPLLEFGVGVLPIDRHQPSHIAAEIDRLGLDPAKLWLGIGAGQLRSPVGTIQQAVAELRELLPEQTRVVVAAMRATLPRRRGDSRRRPAQLDASRPSSRCPPMGRRGGECGGTRCSRRRVIRSRGARARRLAATP